MRLWPRLLARTTNAPRKVYFFVAPTRRNPRSKPRRRNDRAAKAARLISDSFHQDKLVCPGVPALEGKIVSVGHRAPLRGRGFEYLIWNTVALAIGDRLLFGLEAQTQLLTHVA